MNVGLQFLVGSCMRFRCRVFPCKKVLPELVCGIDFGHKILSDVNIPSIVNSNFVKNMLPAGIRNKFSVKFVYKFGKTIGGKLLNYNQVLKNAGVSDYNDILAMSCDCDSSSFKNNQLGHVITGDLDIIQNGKLRELCSFGAKFRENPVLALGTLTSTVMKGFDQFKGKLARKFSLPVSSFKKWKRTFLNAFRCKLGACVNHFTYRLPVLSDADCKRELAGLKEKYVITVVDKAANNFAFTCKKFYFMKLASELGMDNPEPGNDTYIFDNCTENQIVDRIKLGISKFRFVPESSEEKLALLYQTPKFHKNPPKMRYIAGNVKTVTSRLDATVALIMKSCKGHFVNLCRKNEEYSGRKFVFDAQTSLEVKQMFDSATMAVNSISINDFSTLYTLFDHDHLLGNVSWLLGRLSKNSGYRHFRIGYDSAWWVHGNSEGIVYSLDEVLEMVDYLVRNSYIRAFGSIFRQARGIIMGGRSSGWLSDCSLMVDEFRYVESKVKAGLTDEADSLRYFRRYRDDCTSLNIANFLQIAGEIYPPSLSLTQENEDLNRANVLDMVAVIENGRIRTSIYCKADHFPFSVISLPYLDSNIDTRICYKVFYSQVVRYQRLCSLRVDFETRTKFLATNLLDRHYSYNLLRKQFCRVVTKFSLEFQKWTLPSDLAAWFQEILR